MALCALSSTLAEKLLALGRPPSRRQANQAHPGTRDGTKLRLELLAFGAFFGVNIGGNSSSPEAASGVDVEDGAGVYGAEMLLV